MRLLINRIRTSFANPDSQHRKITLGFLWVSLFVFVGKLAGAAKEMTIAWRYGVSATVDAYVFVFNLVNWPVSIWFSILTVVLVPLIARLNNSNPQELPRFRSELLGLTLLFGLTLGVAMWFGLPFLLSAGWLGLSVTAQAEALSMVSGLALVVPLGVVISLLSAGLLAVGRHRNTLFEAIPALTLLVCLLLPSDWMPEPLLWGTVAGFALHMAALAVPLHRRGELQAPTFHQRSPEWRFFWGSIGVMAVGQVLMSFTNLIDQLFAVGLGEGALSTLSYANRILTLILGMIAMAIGRSTLPVFSAMQTGSPAMVSRIALQWAMLMFLVGLVVLVVGWVLAPWMVSVLFERGAFNQRDTYSVAQVLSAGFIQLPFYAAGLVFVSCLGAMRKYAAIATIAATNLVVKSTFNYLFLDLYGIVGLMYAAGVMSFSSCVLCYFAASRLTSE